MNRKLNLKEKVEHKNTSIIKCLEEIDSFKMKLRTDYVPAVVISNLNQTVKDLDVTHGLFKFLSKKRFRVMGLCE